MDIGTLKIPVILFKFLRNKEYATFTEPGDSLQQTNFPWRSCRRYKHTKGRHRERLAADFVLSSWICEQNCLACAVTTKPKIKCIYFENLELFFFLWQFTQICWPFLPSNLSYLVCILYRQFLRSNIRRQCHACIDVEKCFSVSLKRWTNCCRPHV